jgi:hypothetical protein
MKSLFVTAVLLLLSAQVYADWEQAYKDDRTDVTVYADLATIRRRADVAEMWALYDYQNPQRAVGASYLSRKVKNEYNCTQEVKRMIEVIEFSGNMASGKVVYRNTFFFTKEPRWTPVRLGLGEALLKLACGRQ